MSKKARTVLFLICLLLFFLTTPLIILYSLGYRFNWNPSAGGIKLTQTGGFGFKIQPKQVKIYIDGKLIKKTDFILGSALVENLLPKRYKVELKKEGYLTWEKNLEIEEKKVVEIKNIILFPENIDFVALSGGVENFWFSPDEKKLILLEKDNSFSPSSLLEESSELEEENEKGWSLKLYDLERNIKSHLISKADLNQNEVKLLNLEFSEDSREIYLDIETTEVSSGSESLLLANEQRFNDWLDEATAKIPTLTGGEREWYEWIRDFFGEKLSKSKKQRTTDSISESACLLSQEKQYSAIIASTLTGRTARMISRFRPEVLILGCVHDTINSRKLALSFGAYPINISMVCNKTGGIFNTADEIFEQTVDTAKTEGRAQKDDMVIFVAGVPLWSLGEANSIQIKEVK